MPFLFLCAVAVGLPANLFLIFSPPGHRTEAAAVLGLAILVGSIAIAGDTGVCHIANGAVWVFGCASALASLIIWFERRSRRHWADVNAENAAKIAHAKRAR
jgi:hypothetical protein